MAKAKKKPSVKPSPSSSPAPDQPPASAGSPSRPFLAPATPPAPSSVSSSRPQIKQEQCSTDTDEEDHYTSTSTLPRPSPGSFPRSSSSSTRPFPSSPSYSRSSAAQPSFTTPYIRPTPPRPSSRQSSAASPAPRAPPLATQVRQKSSFLGRLVWSLSKLLLLHFWWPILLVIIASVLGMKLWYGYERISNILSLPLSSLSLLSSSAKALTPLLTSLYCSTISLGCSRLPSSSSPPPTLHIGRVARSLTDEASRASDIFASVVELSSLQGLGLHQTEIWELAMTVKRGSSLDNKEILAGELTELGDLTRDMKDRMIGINSQGINAFSWILQEFTRLEAHLETLAPPSLPSSPSSSSSNPQQKPQARKISPQSLASFQSHLASLITHLSTSLISLQSSVEATLPLADRASRLGGRLQEEFFASELMLEGEVREEPVWKDVVQGVKGAVVGTAKKASKDGVWGRKVPGGFEDFFGTPGREEEMGMGGVGNDRDRGLTRRGVVKRDLKMTRETVGRLKDLRRGMEDLRSELVGYRDNVGWFRAGVVGYWAGSSDEDGVDGMDAEVEMEALRSMISKFSGAVDEAKSRGKTGVTKRAGIEMA